MFSIKNLLKVTMICLCAMFMNLTSAIADDSYQNQLKGMTNNQLAAEKKKLEELVKSAQEATQQLNLVNAEIKNRPTMIISSGDFTTINSSIEEDAAILGNMASRTETTTAVGSLSGVKPEDIINGGTVETAVGSLSGVKPEDIINGGTGTTEVNTVVNNNGNITTSTGAGNSDLEDAAITQETPATTSATPPTETPATTSATPPTETPTQKYTGVYNGRQLIPELMAQHCKITEEKLKEIAEHPDKLEECIVQYLKEMNSKEKNAQAQAIKDYNMLRFATLLDVQTTAIAQTGNVNNYEETMNKYGQATMEADTKFDMEGALTNTQAFSTDVMNGIRTLYAEFLKYAAIDGFATIDKSAFIDETAETPDPAAAPKPVTTTGTVDEHAVVATATITDGVAHAEVKGTYDPTTKKCSVNGTVGACADGTYEDKDGNFWDCEQNRCTKQYSIDLVEINDNYDKYINNLEQSNLHQYAGQREKIAEITTELQKIINDPNATADQKKSTQELLDKLRNIDEAKKIMINGTSSGAGTVDISNIPANNVPGLDAAVEFTSFIQFNATNPSATPAVIDPDVAAASQLTPDQFLQKAQQYHSQLRSSDPEVKKEAQRQLEILSKAAKNVVGDRSCVQLKRDYGLKLDCNDWNGFTNI